MNRPHFLAVCLVYTLLCPTGTAQTAKDIRTLVAELDRLNSTDRAAAQIARLASRDSAAREYVIRRLPEMIDRQETNKVWMNSVVLAGQLKDEEAVSSLQHAMARGKFGTKPYTDFATQEHLDDDIVGRALSEIGDPAIPAVRALLENGDYETRVRAVLILEKIGSPTARRMLQDWIPREPDPKLKDMIQYDLRS
jgi:HEAT repeat protein